MGSHPRHPGNGSWCSYNVSDLLRPSDGTSGRCDPRGCSIFVHEIARALHRRSDRRNDLSECYVPPLGRPSPAHRGSRKCRGFLRGHQEPANRICARHQFVLAYSRSFRTVFEVLVGLVGLKILASFLIRNRTLSQNLGSEYFIPRGRVERMRL
jgi:hypothetical protein